MAEESKGYLLDFSLEVLDFTYGADETVLDHQSVVQVRTGNAAANGSDY